MAKVKIEAQNQDGRKGWYDFSEIPPLDDTRYVSSYNYAYGYADILWSWNGGLDTQFGFEWYVDGEKKGSRYKFGDKEPRRGWRSINLTTFMSSLTNRTNDAGLTEMNVYYYGDNIYTDKGNPYIEIDYVPIPITISSPSLSNVSLSNDKPITLSWVHDGSPQYEYEIKYVNNGLETIKKVQSDAQSHTFEISELPEGKITYQIRLSNGFIKSEWTAEKAFTTYAFKVTSLEPDNVAQNKDKPIKSGWSGSDPYTKYEFEYSSSKETKVITGTTGNSYNFPANFFDVETVTLKIRLYNGYIWTEWRTAIFFTYGKPETPKLTTQLQYETATPKFTWNSSGQVSYRLQILKDDLVIIDSGNVYSSAKWHAFDTFLQNNTTYTAKLSISNQYEYASDYSTRNFKIVFEELQTPHFDMFSDDKLGRILFNIYNAEGQTDFGYCELYRREYGDSKWLQVATSLPLTATYTDYTCRSGVLYEYKARAVGATGGYTDGGIGLKRVRLRNTMLSDTSDLDNYAVLIHNPTKRRLFKKETHIMSYNGTSKPTFEFGETRYKTMKLSFTVDERTLDKLTALYYDNNILMLRDNRGKRLYGYIDGDIEVDDAELMNYTVSFNFTETNYIEGVLV